MSYYWILTPSRYREGIASGDLVPPFLLFSNLRSLVVALAEREPNNYDVWVQPPAHPHYRLIQANVPGVAHAGWFPFKYTPAPEEWLLLQRNVPVGNFADFELLTPRNFSPAKSVSYHRNEIEAALVEGDLHRYQVDEAMRFLPDLVKFYNYLELKGAHKSLNIIRRLLSY